MQVIVPTNECDRMRWSQKMRASEIYFLVPLERSAHRLERCLWVPVAAWEARWTLALPVFFLRLGRCQIPLTVSHNMHGVRRL